MEGGAPIQRDGDGDGDAERDAQREMERERIKVERAAEVAAIRTSRHETT